MDDVVIVGGGIIGAASAYLMIPYLLWCCFALILNSSLIMLN